MQPEDVVRIWNESHRQEERRGTLTAIVIMVGVFVGLGLLAWWVK